jgi:D-alanine transaminase
VFAMCRPLAMSTALLRVSAVTLPDNRWGRCDIKATSLLPNVLLRNEAVRRGAYDAILIRDGWLTEGAASNVFVVHGGQVRTPPNSAQILPGVTRALVLELARRAGHRAVESAVRADELTTADEIWITSSSRDLVCVHELDGRPVGDGRSYPLAENVFAAFQDYRVERLSGA